MPSVIQHNAHILAERYRQRGMAVRQALGEELNVQAQLVARAMRARVAKFRSELVNSIHVRSTGTALGADTEVKVAVGSAHGWYVEHGVKPGGKGLPRFFDPESADVVAWLQSKLRAGAKSPRRRSKAFQAAELALRDAYHALAWHVRHKGVKAQPFVEPTAREMAHPVALALRRRVLQVLTQPGSGGTA